MILHGSRSGAAGNTTAQEYLGTARFAGTGAGGLGWNITCGAGRLAIHMLDDDWGWNARACSSLYLACEFAQPVEAAAISDEQVDAFAWWFLNRARKRWPTLPAVFPTHAELDGTAAYGGYIDGKTDVFSKGSARADELRTRIMARLR